MFEDRYIDVKGIKTRYWQEGQGEPMVLVHGLGATIEYWELMITDLANHFTIIVLDLPGFGKTDKPAVDYDLPYFANFLNDFYDAKQIDAAFLVGHSLGGGLCLQFAINHRSRVKKLFLCDNVGFAKQVTWAFRLMSIPWICNLFLYRNRLMYEQTLKLSVHIDDNLTEDLVDRLYAMAKTDGHKNTVRYILKHHAGMFGMKTKSVKPIWLKLKSLSDLPVFVLWGAKDRLLNVKHLKSAKKRLPHIKIKILENCGHVPMLEYPSVCAKLIMNFFMA